MVEEHDMVVRCTEQDKVVVAADSQEHRTAVGMLQLVVEVEVVHRKGDIEALDAMVVHRRHRFEVVLIDHHLSA